MNLVSAVFHLAASDSCVAGIIGEEKKGVEKQKEQKNSDKRFVFFSSSSFSALFSGRRMGTARGKHTGARLNASFSAVSPAMVHRNADGPCARRLGFIFHFHPSEPSTSVR